MAGETEDLDPIVAALRRIIRAIDLHSKRLAQRCGLTGPQLVVLQQLKRRGPLTTSQLVDAVSLGQATLSEMLDRLEGRKLIRRTPSATDRRSVLNELTRAGRTAVDEAPPLLQEHFVRELRRLEDWERSLVLSTLQRVAKMMDADEIQASPVLVSGPIGVSAQETVDFLAETGVPSDKVKTRAKARRRRPRATRPPQSVR